MILSPCVVLGTSENAGVTPQSRPLLGPQEGRGEVATSNFLFVLGIGDP